MNIPSPPLRSDGVRGVLLAGLLLRTALAFLVPLTPEEAYHWTWSKHLDLCYLDHPPLLAWIIAATTSVLGDTVIGIRAGPLLLGTLGAGALAAAARRLYGGRAERDAAVLGQTVPVLCAAGALGFPDAPLLAAWSLALAAVVRALQTGRTADWLRVGLAAGLVVLSKLTGLLLFPALGLGLLLTRDGRRALRGPGPWLALAIGLLGLAPILIWNADHGWATFQFQFARRAADMGAPHPKHLLRFASQQGLIAASPILAAGMAWAFARAWRPVARSGAGPGGVLLAASALPLAAFAVAALRGDTHVLWPAPAYPAAVVILAGALGAHPAAAASYPLARALLLRAAPALNALALLALAAYARYIPPVLREVPTAVAELHGWPELAREVRARVDGARDAAGRPPFVAGFGRSFGVQSHLLFRLGNAVEIHGQEVVGYPALQFTYWTDFAALQGRSGIVIADTEARYNRARELAAPCFERTEPLPPVTVPSPAGSLTFRLFRGDGYKYGGRPLPYYIGAKDQDPRPHE